MFQGLFVPPLSWFVVRRDAPVCCMYIVVVKYCCPEFDPVRKQWTSTVSHNTRMMWFNMDSGMTTFATAVIW